MPVEELDVAVQVLVEIAARDKRPALGLNHPHFPARSRTGPPPERAPSQTLQSREQAGRRPRTGQKLAYRRENSAPGAAVTRRRNARRHCSKASGLLSSVLGLRLPMVTGRFYGPYP